METVLPILVAIGLLIAMGIEWSSRPRTRAWRVLRGMRSQAIADIKDGDRARITGAVSALGETLASPFGEKPCIGFRIEIRRVTRGNPTVVQREECSAFAMTDESGKAIVDGPFLFGLDWEKDWSIVPARWYGLLRAEGVQVQQGLFAYRFAYRQALLVPGDRVTACGVASLQADPNAPAANTRSPALRLRLSGTKDELVAVADASRLGGREPASYSGGRG